MSTASKLPASVIQNARLKVSDLGVSKRIENSLNAYGFPTVHSLLLTSEKELLKLPGFGHRSVAEISRKLAEMELKVGMLLPYSGELAGIDIVDADAINCEIERDITVVPEVKPVPDPVIKWMKNAMPEHLKNGLSQAFLMSVLENPQVQQRVQDVIVEAVLDGLDLNRIK